MSNTLAAYDPIFYAQEALIAVEKALGMSGRVHRGHDASPQQKGSTITISAPATFEAQDAPSTEQAINASELSIRLDYWKEVKFALTDKELTFTKEKIITDHIRPASYALADKVDTILCALTKDIPWYSDWSSPAAVADITAARKVLFNNRVPLVPGMVHCMVDGDIEAELLNLTAFTQHQGSGEAGVAAQMAGHVGTRYGIEFFANQNTYAHTSGTAADAAGAVDLPASGYAAGVKTIHVDGITDGGTIKIGDPILITGHTQQYVATADATFAGGEADVSFEPGLEAAVVDDQVVTLVLGGAAKSQSLMFHRNFAAIAFAPLSEMGAQLGAKMATVTDPITGLSLRSRLWYDGDNSKVKVALDVLFGVKTLNRNLATRVRN